ncbi:TetR family transcriptional regulator [Sphaerisporangium sp. NPDC088356]|uniref:TetR family transcriptional regulator n=1 Tax=Sphaerisporangium sp. NPDC088356 TaxID=3154871 RepID=UPI00342CF841
MVEVAEAAQVAKVTLFKYFPAKEALDLGPAADDLGLTSADLVRFWRQHVPGTGHSLLHAVAGSGLTKDTQPFPDLRGDD